MGERSGGGRTMRRRGRQRSASRLLTLALMHALVALALAVVGTDAAAAATAAATASAASDATDAQSMRCWKVLDGARPQVISTFTGASCAVDVAFPLVSARFSPNETIPVFWTVRLLTATQTTNDLKMKVPPVKTSTASADNFGKLVQIPETLIRVCSSREQCDPTVAALATTSAQSGDFSTSSASVLFQSVGELRLAKEGRYVLAAQVRIVDDVIPSIVYYYTAFSEVTIAAAKKRTPVLDKRTTYCRRSSQDALSAALEPSQSILESSSCEVRVAVDSPDVAQANASVALAWNVTLARDATKDIRLPTPLTPLDVALDGKLYEIVRSSVKVCKKSVACDEYSSTASGELETMANASVQAGNFSNNVAVFRTDALKLPATTGAFTAFTHVVLAGPNARRFDVMTYFQIVVTADDVAAQVSAEPYNASNGRSYCWQVVGRANASALVPATSVMAMGKTTECPYAIQPLISAASFPPAVSTSISWVLKQQSAFATTKFSNVSLTTVRDPTTNALVNVAQVAVYYCAADARCSPFSPQRELLYAAPATNLTGDGTARFTSSSFAFKTPGNYTLFVHAVLPNGDAVRFDTAAFMRLTVTAPVVAAAKSSRSKVGTIIGVVAGVIGGLLLVFFAVVFTRRYLAKQRRSRVGKEPVFAFRSHTMESPERNRTDSRESNASDASGTFMYVKAAPSPMENTRANSLSYDPFARPSYTDVTGDDGNYTFALPDDDAELPSTSSSTRHL